MNPKRTTGFRRVIERNENKARETYNKRLSEREEHILRLKEKFENTKGLAFGKGKLDEMFQKDARKASNLVLFLENSEKEAYNNPILLQNANQKMIMEAMAKENRLTEAMQTGGAMALMLPSDIVKISRIGYSNSVAQDIFDVWGMESMKDSLYKLETIYGSTERGATAGDVIYEDYGEGRYPSVIEKEALTPTDSTHWGGTLTNHPLIPFKANLIVNDVQVAVDNGSGAWSGDGVTGTLNYASGVITVVFSTAPAGGTSADVEVQYAYDFEDASLFGETGSVLLNLVAYDFSAILYPLAIEWTRFTQDLMQSKLGLSAKDMLIAGAGDEFRKAFDERCIKRGIQASGWTAGETFDTDFASAGADSSDAHAQAVISAIVNTENLTYNRLGRLADTTNIVCDSLSYAYLSKHRQFVSITPTSKVGIFKVGELAGRGIYMAPKSVINPSAGEGLCYMFGKSTQGQNVDAPVSVGTYGSGISTAQVELKNFNSQMGIGVYADLKLNNKYFATKLTLKNLSSNS